MVFGMATTDKYIVSSTTTSTSTSPSSTSTSTKYYNTGINERFPCTRRCMGAEEFARRDNFATRNERKAQEGYGKDPSIDRETIANYHN